VSRFGDPEDEPATFLATRLFAGVVAVVVVGTGVFGDPLWLSLAFGGAVGGAFASTSYLLHRVFN
jgi:hypothetical protein